MPHKQLPEYCFEVLKALPHEKNSKDESQIVWDALHRNIRPRCELRDADGSAFICRDASCINHFMCQRSSTAVAVIIA